MAPWKFPVQTKFTNIIVFPNTLASIKMVRWKKELHVFRRKYELHLINTYKNYQIEKSKLESQIRKLENHLIERGYFDQKIYGLLRTEEGRNSAFVQYYYALQHLAKPTSFQPTEIVSIPMKYTNPKPEVEDILHWKPDVVQTRERLSTFYGLRLNDPKPLLKSEEEQEQASIEEEEALLAQEKYLDKLDRKEKLTPEEELDLRRIMEKLKKKIKKKKREPQSTLVHKYPLTFYHKQYETIHPHRKNNKAWITVRINKLGLSKEVRERLIFLAGNRYDPEKKCLKLTSDKLPSLQQNYTRVKQLFAGLLTEAYQADLHFVPLSDDQHPPEATACLQQQIGPFECEDFDYKASTYDRFLEQYEVYDELTLASWPKIPRKIPSKFTIFRVFRLPDPQVYESSRQQLDQLLGKLDTVLATNSYKELKQIVA